MSIKLITACTGKDKCPYFRSPEALLDVLQQPHNFKNLMTAIESIKSWKETDTCPMAVMASGSLTDKSFHSSICSLASKPPYSMEAVSKGTGYSKTQVAKLEYSAVKKIKKAVLQAPSSGEGDGD